MDNYAGNYSRACEKASNAVHAAEKKLSEILAREYPIGSSVRVVHSRGWFYGEVTGTEHFGCRVMVRNEQSGKIGKWWMRHVELV